MKKIVITGSSRGIGFGLADAFLGLGCAVTVSGRYPHSVGEAVERLKASHSDDAIHGFPCDVSRLEQVEDLWRSATTRFGGVDIWINNAGIGHAMLPLWELPPDETAAVVAANLNGVIYGSRVAIQGMIAQGQGQLYNMLGHGSKGRVRDGMSVYGATKAAVKNLSLAMIGETRDTPVQVGTLSPGMVTTALLMDRLDSDPQILERGRRIFNILTDHVETVCPWLAEKVLENDKSGCHIEWLTNKKITWRFLTAPFNRREIFGETEEQQEDGVRYEV
jgi:NAD(P)-dependent dehydrogenase (short-subunit alcohol dehydrogenase family)